jgi:predicted phage terminase large subunit-like protein
MSLSNKAALTTIPDADLHGLLGEICKRDFYEFVQTFWHVVIKEKPVWNWHIQFLCDELQVALERVIRREPKEYDLIINVPPGSSKSTVCSQMLPAWCWTRDPTLRFITGSYAYDLATEHAEYQRQIVTSDLYRRLYPHVQLHATRNARHNYRTTEGGQRFSCGTGGAVLGVHAHVLIPDDPINPKEAASEADLKAANRWMNETLSGRKVDRNITLTILIQQRLHEDDPSGHDLRIRPGEIRHICLPAEDTDDVRPPELRGMYKDGLLDPVRLSRAVLDREKIKLGSFGYSAQMLQRPVPEEGGILKKGWFKVLSMEDVLGMARQWLPGAPSWNFTADLAYTAKEINDPSGILAYSRIGPYVAIRCAERFRLEQPDLERRLPTWTMANGYSDRSMLMIEPKANGISTVQNLRARTKLNVIASKAPTKDKVSRTRDVSPLIESGRVILVDGDWVETFLDEVCNFPFARHDEFVDCLTMALDRESAAGLGSASMDRTRSTDGFAATGKAARTASEVWDGLV